MKSFPEEFGCRSNDQHFFFLPFSLQKNCLCVEYEIIVSKPYLVFYIMVPEYAEGGLVGQTIITKSKKCQFPPYCRKAPKSFENIQIIVIQEFCNQMYLILIGLLLTKLCDINKKRSSLKETKVHKIIGNFNIVQIFTLVLSQNYEQSTLLAWRIPSSRSCRFPVFVGRYLFTIVPFHGTSSLSVKCLLTGKGTRNSLKFFPMGIGFVVFQERMRPANSSVPPNVIFKSARILRSLLFVPQQLWGIW